MVANSVSPNEDENDCEQRRSARSLQTPETIELTGDDESSERVDEPSDLGSSARSEKTET